MAGRRSAFAILLCLLLASTPASAAPPSAGGGLLRLVSLTPAIEAGAPIELRVAVTGSQPDRQLRVTLYGRTRTRSGFQATLGGAALGRPVAPPVLAPAAPDGAGTVAVTIATDPTAAPPVIAVPEEGVFPLSVELLDGTTVLDRLLAYVVRLPAPASDTVPLTVATVVPLHGPLGLQPDGELGVSDADRRASIERAGVLADRPSVPVTLDATPEWAAALAADPATAPALRAAAAGRTVAARPYVDLDPSAWLAGGLGEELGQEVDAGRAAAASALGGATDDRTWIADGPLTPDALRWLRARGVTAAVVPDEGLSAVDRARFPATLAQPFRVEGVDGMTVAAADPALPAHLVGDDPRVAANHVLADLAILYLDAPKTARFTVLRVPDDVEPEALDALLAGLAQLRILRPSTVSAAFAAVPVVGARGQADGGNDPLVRQLSVPAPTAPDGLAAPLREGLADLSTYIGTIVDPGGRADAIRDRLLAAGDRSLLPGEARDRIDRARGAIRSDLGKVAAPARQVITFTAREGVVSFAVRNDAGVPMRAVAHLQGSKLELPGHEDGTLPLVLDGESTRVEVSVRTKASGDSPLDIRITTPDGRIELARTRVTIRSTAFSGVGVLLSIGAGAFLLAWWGKHIVQSRRARRARHPASRGTPTG